ncbi:Riboflavin transporter MCH5 [Termitomyces sp. J132]|nr:Riboflavin transporter MCH5 [Termitomyces sp. J132]
MFPSSAQSNFDLEKEDQIVGGYSQSKTDMWHPDASTSEGHGLGTLQEMELVPAEYPEGGLRAWSVLLGAWIAQFCTFGYTNAYGVYNGSTQLLLVLSIGLFAGRAFDTGYFYHLMIGGSLLLVLCIFMISLSQPGQYYQIFLAQGLGVGTAVGITYVPCISILSHYFHRRRALAMGIAVSGSGVGGAVHSILLNHLFHGSVGFAEGVRVSAGVVGGLLLIAILLMKPRLPPTSRKHGSTLRDLRVFSRDPPYVIMVIGTVLLYAGIYFPIFFLQLNAITNGVTPNVALNSLLILNGASSVGRILPGLLVLRIGIFNVMIPCALVSGLLAFCTAALRDVAGTVVFAILYGFFSGAYVSLLSPMVASLAEKDSEIGARLGICFTFTGAGACDGFWTPIAGALLSKNFIWWRPSLFSGLCVTTGGLLFFLTRTLVARKKRTSWL